MSLEDLLLLAGGHWTTLVAMVAAVWLLSKVARAATNAVGPTSRAPRPEKAPAAGAARPRANPGASHAGAARAQASPEVLRLRSLLLGIARQSQTLAMEVQRERANRRFVPLLTGWIPEQVRELDASLGQGSTQAVRVVDELANRLLLVLGEVRELIRQRRDPSLLPQLGDADALAEACYAPIVRFAQAEGLPLTTAWPVTRLSEMNLAIWTGFAPTSIAPIFLPQGFFDSFSYWPALAHEIGHDFLISVRGLDQALREELRIPSEATGSLPLRFDDDGLPYSEAQRVFGAWFEEIFSDTFGTLMLGPAYVGTMCQHFASRGDAHDVLVVPFDPETLRTDVHPPGQLRVHIGCWVLERAGLRADAAALRARWNDHHGFAPEAPLSLYFPAGGRYVGLPLAAFVALLEPLLERLYAGPLTGLSQMGLTAVSGLDFGPHEQAETQRACASLLAGEVPTVRDARAIIAGAALAARAAPRAEAQLLARARAAIPAIGTLEHRPDAFRPTELDPRLSRGLDMGRDALVEALLLYEILEPPSARTARRRGA
ncbi:MAG: hypothetical protein HY901_15160 [Deltaproteobacteria bacterium]|nr:hypothetical protein [Deltaproteobacteria bacterium]